MLQLAKLLILPPISPLLLILAGLLLARRRRRLGHVLTGIGAGALLLLSIPFVAAALLISLQTADPLPVDGPLPTAEAIVVLGGDLERRAPERRTGTVGPLSLQRARYGAELARRSGLPVLVTGGRLTPGAPSLGHMMEEALGEFGVQARWVEARAANTRENARLSAEILESEGISRILLVTHAWHLPRASAAFEAQGLEVVAAPTAFRIWPDLRLTSLLPSARALRESRWAVHEWLGRLWYALRW